MVYRTLLGCILFAGMAPWASGAARANVSPTQSEFNVRMVRLSEPILIDGNLNDAAWEQADYIPFFQNHWPQDSGRAKADTEVWIGYDDNFVYVSAKVHDQGQRVVQSLLRDDPNHWNSDGFTVVLDPINQRTNGFMFGVNAGGAQVEGTVKSGGGRPVDMNWDNKWFSAIEKHDRYWTVEMAIPFNTLRFNSEVRTWGLNFIRSDMGNNVYQTWTRFPNNFPGVDLGFTGALSWTEAPPTAKRAWAVIPYAAGSLTRDFDAKEPYQVGGSVGADAKVSVTPSLNLDLTLNPDFSNVNVDIQQTNLTRFSLFFPEQRPFFLENSDLFADFGNWSVRPFFTRQIGLNGGQAVPILYGARLSGNVTDNTRIGLMNIQTRATETLGAENVTVAAVQQRIWARSSIKALVVNKHTAPLAEGGTAAYNRNVGGEFLYTSANGRWNATAKYHVALDSETPRGDNSFYHVEVSNDTRNYFWGVGHHRVGKNFVAESGFTPRLFNYDAERDSTVRVGFSMFNAWGGYNVYPKKGPVLRHSARSWHQLYLNPDQSLNEFNSNLVYNAQFRGQQEVSLRVNRRQLALPFATTFVSGGQALPAQQYTFTQASLSLSSDPRKAFSFRINGTAGGFYNGNLYAVGGALTYRQQPWGTFALNYQMNRVVLPEAYGQTTLHLLGPQVNVAFSNTMFWTTVLQYNTQAEQINLYSRFQWRYRPMSDLFLVYSDNYISENLAPMQRGLVVKLTYWLN